MNPHIMLERSRDEYSDNLLALLVNSFELCFCVCVCVCVCVSVCVCVCVKGKSNSHELSKLEESLYIKEFADSQRTEQVFVANCLASSGIYLQGDLPVQVRSIRKIPKPQEPFLSFPHLPNQIFWLFVW